MTIRVWIKRNYLVVHGLGITLLGFNFISRASGDLSDWLFGSGLIVMAIALILSLVMWNPAQITVELSVVGASLLLAFVAQVIQPADNEGLLHGAAGLVFCLSLGTAFWLWNGRSLDPPKREPHHG